MRSRSQLQRSRSGMCMYCTRKTLLWDPGHSQHLSIIPATCNMQIAPSRHQRRCRYEVECTRGAKSCAWLRAPRSQSGRSTTRAGAAAPPAECGWGAPRSGSPSCSTFQGRTCARPALASDQCIMIDQLGNIMQRGPHILPTAKNCYEMRVLALMIAALTILASSGNA